MSTTRQLVIGSWGQHSRRSSRCLNWVHTQSTSLLSCWITSLENYFRGKSGSAQKGQKVISISSPAAAADLSLMKLKCQFSQGEMGGINPSSNPSPFSNVGGISEELRSLDLSTKDRRDGSLQQPASKFGIILGLPIVQNSKTVFV